MKLTRFFLTFLILCLPSLATATTYHYAHHGLTTGLNDGSSWANAWRNVDNINWSAFQSEAATQPVYVYFKKGVTVSENDMIIRGSGSSDTNRIILTVDPSDSGTTPVFDGGYTTAYPINIRGNYITIEHFHVTRAASCNIFQYDTDANYIIIQDCIIDYAGGHGIYSGNTNNHPTEGPKGDNWIVRRCLFDSNGTQQSSLTHGIYVRYGDNWTVEYCKFINHLYGFAVEWASKADNWIVRYNYTENNGKMGAANGDKGGGFSAFDSSSNYQIYYNVSNNDRVGIFINSNDSSGAKIIGNIVYNSSIFCFFVQPNYVVGAVYNNIFWSSSASSSVFYVSSGGILTKSDYNAIGPERVKFVNYGSSAYNSLSAYSTATGKDVHSINSDPLFSDPTNGHLSLGAGSPCIRAGTDLGAPYSDHLDPSTSWPHSVITRKQTIPWDIGAFAYPSVPTEPPTNLRIIQ